MERTVAGVLTTVTALALGQVHAAPTQPPPTTMEAAMQASSYADLLTPIPNALALLQAEPATPRVQKAAFNGDQPVDHHHHHHHHHHRRRHRHHYAPPPPPPPPVLHHHHHHHHNQQQL